MRPRSTIIALGARIRAGPGIGRRSIGARFASGGGCRPMMLLSGPVQSRALGIDPYTRRLGACPTVVWLIRCIAGRIAGPLFTGVWGGTRAIRRGRGHAGLPGRSRSDSGDIIPATRRSEGRSKGSAQEKKRQVNSGQLFKREAGHFGDFLLKAQSRPSETYLGWRRVTRYEEYPVVSFLKSGANHIPVLLQWLWMLNIHLREIRPSHLSETRELGSPAWIDLSGSSETRVKFTNNPASR